MKRAILLSTLLLNVIGCLNSGHNDPIQAKNIESENVLKEIYELLSDSQECVESDIIEKIERNFSNFEESEKRMILDLSMGKRYFQITTFLKDMGVEKKVSSGRSRKRKSSEISYKCSDLYIAARDNDIDKALLLLKSGEEPEDRFENPLHAAIRNRSLEMTMALLNHGASPDFRERNISAQEFAEMLLEDEIAFTQDHTNLVNISDALLSKSYQSTQVIR